MPGPTSGILDKLGTVEYVS